MKEWWSQLALREKRAVIIGGIALGLFILYQGIWSPWLAYNEDMRHRITVQQKTLRWMQQADMEIQSLQHHLKDTAKSKSPIALLGVLQKQIDQSTIASSLVELKQASSDTISMRFQKVSFDSLMSFLTKMIKETGMSIVQLTAIAETTPGIVNADIVVK